MFAESFAISSFGGDVGVSCPEEPSSDRLMAFALCRSHIRDLADDSIANRHGRHPVREVSVPAFMLIKLFCRMELLHAAREHF